MSSWAGDKLGEEELRAHLAVNVADWLPQGTANDRGKGQPLFFLKHRWRAVCLSPVLGSSCWCYHSRTSVECCS